MHLSIVGIVALMLSCALAHMVLKNEADARSMYEEFKRKYNKVNTKENDNLRFSVFRDNLKRIDQVQKSEQGSAQYGVTKFADLTAEEFTATYTNARLKTPDQNRAQMITNLPKQPLSCDWREERAVGPVVDSFACNAGWAISTVGNIEGQYAIKHNKFLSLSKQQLLDCRHHVHGCNGSSPASAYEQIIEMGGLMSEYHYPFEAGAGICRKDSEKYLTFLKSFSTLPENEEYLSTYLSENGPLSASMNVGELQFYESGVVHPENCSSDILNLDVLLVGYNLMEFEMQWIVRNSWGENWGEQGYFRILLNAGMCGINRAVISATLED